MSRWEPKRHHDWWQNAAQAVGVEADGPELESELHGVIVVDDTEVVDERERIAGVGLSSSILGAVGADQVA